MHPFGSKLDEHGEPGVPTSAYYEPRVVIMITPTTPSSTAEKENLTTYGSALWVSFASMPRGLVMIACRKM
jgi:hypothetical protein